MPDWLLAILLIPVWLVALFLDVRGFVAYYVRRSDISLREAIRRFYGW